MIIRPGIQKDYRERFLDDPQNLNHVAGYMADLRINADNARQFGNVALLSDLEMRLEAASAFLTDTDEQFAD